MSKWLITTHPGLETPKTVWFFTGSTDDTEDVLWIKTREKCQPLALWRLVGHTSVDARPRILSPDEELE